jgi:hypothetical protein
MCRTLTVTFSTSRQRGQRDKSEQQRQRNAQDPNDESVSEYFHVLNNLLSSIDYR